MPIYEFWCRECGEEYEELVRASDDDNPPCPSCGSAKVDRNISRVGSFVPGASSCGTKGFS